MGVPPDGKQVRGYYDAWHTACRKAGLPGKLVHDFRRSAVRNLVRAGLSERVAMTITGHKTRSVFDRYHIVSPADLEQVAHRLDLYAQLEEQRAARARGRRDGEVSAAAGTFSGTVAPRAVDRRPLTYENHDTRL